MVQLQKEIDEFIRQTFEMFEERGMTHNNHSFKFLVEKNLESLYLQCKYIKEEFGNGIFMGKMYNQEKYKTIERLDKIIKKLIWRPNAKNKSEAFLWRGYGEEFEINEYLDILIHIFSSIFEFYVQILKNGKMFNCIELAKKLEMKELIPKIDNYENLKKLYQKLKEKTEEK